MKEILLIRHSQASFHEDDYDNLSPLGHQQSLWLGEHLATRKIAPSTVFTGNQKRHKQTAELIARGMNLEVKTIELPELSEFDFHDIFCAAGSEYLQILSTRTKTPKLFFQTLKQVLKLWTRNELATPPKESWQEFRTRVSKVLTFLADQSEDNIMVVSSGGPISTMIGLTLKCDPDTIIGLNFQIANSSISRLIVGESGPMLAGFNLVCHLESADRSHAITYG